MATRFWVGGTGTWDSTSTTHWATSTGGSSGASAPTTGDAVTFDGSSGGGTVTLDSTINNLSLLAFTAGAFTGTIDFSVNNPNLTITNSMNLSGTGARKFLFGTSTITFSAGTGVTTLDFTTTTNLDALSVFNASSLVFNYSGGASSQQNFVTGGRAWGALTVGARTGASIGVGLSLTSSGASFTSFTVGAGADIQFVAAITISGALTINGTTAAPVLFGPNGFAAGNNGAPIGIVVGSAVINGAAIKNLAFSGATVTATQSLDLGGNTGITITPPSGGRMIGG